MPNLLDQLKVYLSINILKLILIDGNHRFDCIMILIRKSKLYTSPLPSPIDLTLTKINAKNGIISTKDAALLKVYQKYGIKLSK